MPQGIFPAYKQNPPNPCAACNWHRRDPRLRLVTGGTQEGAASAAQNNLFGNHIPGVAAMYLGNADNQGIYGADIAADYRLQSLDQLARHDYRVNAAFVSGWACMS